MKKWSQKGGRKKRGRKERELHAWRQRRAMYNCGCVNKMLDYAKRRGDPLYGCNKIDSEHN